ncbi:MULTISPECIES: hypothetical protein [Lysinibacillus]|uniref:hypothetical protein n=1 Tax=Lysinibacillus TaxID=400634 RepID=UPI00214CAC5A|nr:MULTISPECIES: hypothetical protein [Lysinibacillus]UUV23851.1 hypothetical protein NP781_18890 [Lysinibacillus sp. FN11]UYB46723.1 hypothetical protein OCI51_21500 [Lysinibacillus capsici]WHP40757.1 hypothetical protein QIX46_19725 [Lysinibacillus boronitolerans]
MFEQIEQSISRLTAVFSAEQLAGLLIGTLASVAEYKGDDKERFVNEWIESTINELSKRLDEDE